MALSKPSKGKRLTPEEREQIRAAPKNVSAIDLAKKYGVSDNTIRIYRGRKGKKKTFKVPPKQYNKGTELSQKFANRVEISTQGDFVLIKVPKSDFLKRSGYAKLFS